MKSNFFFKTASIILITQLLGYYNMAYCQSVASPNDYYYISPVPGSSMNIPASNILLKTHKDLKEVERNSFRVVGSQSGPVQGDLILLENGSSCIFQPSSNFALGEKISVEINQDVTIGASMLPSLKFHFYITQSKVNVPPDLYEASIKSISTINYSEQSRNPYNGSSYIVSDVLPQGFPDLVTHIYNDPLPGYNFICPYKGGNHYLIIIDNWSTPVFYRKITGGMADFKIQPNGLLTYYSNFERAFFGMNEQFMVVDTFKCQNGYGPATDMHELRIQENGHYFLLAYDHQLVNMDTVVPGGHPEAVVTGLIVQEMDAEDNVLFQWRSWDHFKITDAHHWVDLTDSVIDYVHGNSIEIESDTSLLISCRNMNEITKIDRRTGEIIWRMNGENNDFTFINDSLRYVYQHSIRYMPDSNNLSIFDNGLGNASTPFSSALEYEIDEQNMTATLIKRLYKEPTILGSFMGHAQRHHNGTTTIGWGAVDTSTHTQGYDYVPGITEFNANDEVALEISIPNTNYRAFKYSWYNKALVPDRHKIEFESVLPNDSSSVICYIRNNMPETMVINQVLNHYSHFSCDINGTLSINSMDSAAVKITFVADATESVEDVITFCCDTDENGFPQRIACQIHLVGNPDPNGILINGPGIQDGFAGLYPNPADEHITIEFLNPGEDSKLVVHNMQGVKIGEYSIGKEEERQKLDISDYSNGIYVASLISEHTILASIKFIVQH